MMNTTTNKNDGQALTQQEIAEAKERVLNNPLLKETNLIERFKQDVEKAGLVGEKDNAAALFLVAISAKMREPLSATVNGSSATGKNHLMDCVSRFIPDDSQIFLSGMSEKAMMHAEKNEFRHKVVFIVEYEGVSSADYAIRTMQSERKISYKYTDKTSEFGGFKSVTSQVEGPVAFIQATTRATLHRENETRMLFLQMDETSGQTREIMKRQAEQAEGTASLPRGELFSPWHDLFQSMVPAEVDVPFASQLNDTFPANDVRSRRDFPKLITMIAACAFLHQHQRERRTVEDEECGFRIVASEQDYKMAKQLFEHCFGNSPDLELESLLEACRNLGDDEFTIKHLLESKWQGKKTKAYALVERAKDDGLIVKTPRFGYYSLVGTVSERRTLRLPDTVTTAVAPAEIPQLSAPETESSNTVTQTN